MKRVLPFLILAGCSASRSEPFPVGERPNFVLIIADDVAWDDLGAYGHPTIRTPNLDRLAREGLRFDRAYVTASSCSPSRASLITGRYPHATGAEQLHRPLPAAQTTFVELLRKAGYWTAAAGKWHLGPAVKDRFDLVREAKAGDPSGCSGWIPALRDRPAGKPFFLWLASFDAHRGYEPGAVPDPHRPEDAVVPPFLPDLPEIRKDLALYYDEIARLDRFVGEVLAELDRQGVADETMVLFLSDNGRPFPRCKTTLYESGIRTPLLVRWPGRVEAGEVCGSLVSTVDLAPTFLELAHLDVPATVQGKSLVELLADPGEKVRDFVFAEKNWHDFEDRSRAARSLKYKYVRNHYPDLAGTPPADAVRSPTFQAMRRLRDEKKLEPEQRQPFAAPRPKEELYDVEGDPHELHNLAEDTRYRRILATMRGALDDWEEETKDAAPAARTPDEFDRETGRPLPRVPK
jgi:arylsulfatase A-like enzyme